MSNILFYVADTESNGLSQKVHELCEISLIREDRVQYTCDIKVDNPDNSSIDALRIIGKTRYDLKKGLSKLDAIRQIEEFLSEDNSNPAHRCLVGHNIINFDRKFLCSLWGKYGRKFPFDLYLDTIPMFKAYCKKQGIIKQKSNLTAAVEFFGIKKYGSHNAKDDTRHTYLLWEKLSKEIDFMDHIKHLPHNI